MYGHPHASENRRETALHDAEQCPAVVDISAGIRWRIGDSNRVRDEEWSGRGDGDDDMSSGGADRGSAYAALE